MAITNCYQFTLSIKLYYRSEVKKRKKKKQKRKNQKKKKQQHSGVKEESLILPGRMRYS